MITRLTAILAVSLLATAPAAATSFAGPEDTTRLVTSHGALRLRAFGAPAQQEVFLGRTSLGVPANRTAANLTWQSGANNFSFAYDKGSDTLSAVVNGTALSFANFFAGLDTARQQSRINSMELQLRDAGPGAGSLSLSNLVLNGNTVTPAGFAAPENGTLKHYTGFGKFGDGFTLTGTLNLSGSFGTSAEGNRVEIVLGTAIPEPASWAMMLAGFGLVGTLLRRRPALARA